MRFELPRSFWPTLYRLTGGDQWPPTTDPQAESLIARAVREGLLSLLLSEASLPPAVARAAAKFQALDRTNRLRVRVFEDSLKELAALLADEPIIVLKGTDYAYRLYSAPHLRPRQDIDILVRRDHAAAITLRLRQAGFKLHYPAGAVSRVPAYHEAVFEVGNATIEVHHSFVQRARNRVDYEGVWNRAKPWSGFDSRLLQLDDVDALIYHSINMNSDQFATPLFRHLDVWLMLRDREDILPAAVARAREWATRRALYGALRQTSRYFEELRTPAVENAMQELLPRRTRSFLDRHVLPDPWRPRRRYGRAGQLWRKFCLIDDGLLRGAFALYHVYAVVAGKLLEIQDSRSASRFPRQGEDAEEKTSENRLAAEAEEKTGRNDETKSHRRI